MRPVPSRRRPADFVRPSLGEARIARMWSAVAAAEQARSGRSGTMGEGRSRRAAVLLAVAAAIAAFLVGVRLRPAPAPALGGLVIDTGAATQEVSLNDGSTLSLAPATRLLVIAATAGEIRLRLERGAATCDVIHRESRRFVVEAGGVEVEDRGTRFAVEVRPGEGLAAVAVHVEHGAVEVRDGSRAVVATLTPGQAWRSGVLTPLRPPTAQPEAPPPPPEPSAPRPPVEPPAPPASASARSGAPSPQSLFERADAARLAGRHAEAAAEFERFRRRFPGDPRAGLAAYELGRIRLGSLHDPRGAAEAFAAVLERPDDPFREDAEAGRVEALADLGDDGACRRSRDAFLAGHPRSPLAGRVARLCGRP